MVQVWTKRPLPIGLTVIKSQTLFELGPEELVEKLSRQGFVETVSSREKREAEALRIKKESDKATKKPEKGKPKSG